MFSQAMLVDAKRGKKLDRGLSFLKKNAVLKLGLESTLTLTLTLTQRRPRPHVLLTLQDSISVFLLSLIQCLHCSM